MPTYIVDYSGDHAHVDGVESATYTDPAGNVDNSVQARRGNLSKTDLQVGSAFGVSMSDVAFTIWTGGIVNGELLPGGTLVAGGESFTLITVLAIIPDGSQTRAAFRKHRA